MTPGEPVAVGVDVGADRLHLVIVGAGNEILDAAVLDPLDGGLVDSWFAQLPRHCAVAIDGPPAPSSAPFADDPTVSAKFRRARGCEVELGRQRGIWVSFATGPEPLIGWMAEAARIHDLASTLGHTALETYPHAIYRTLLGRRPAKKATGMGVTERVDALRREGLDHAAFTMWSHDALDAVAAALVARQYLDGVADPVTCTIDGTSIWLPVRALRALTIDPPAESREDLVDDRR